MQKLKDVNMDIFNGSRSQFYKIVFIVLVISQISSAVVRPEHFRLTNPRNEPSHKNSPLATDDLPEVQHYVTAQHCCKIGEYMARHIHSCQLDQPMRTNTLVKSKRNPRNQSEFSKIWQGQLSACQQHQHLMQKCCIYRRVYLKELEICQDKPNILERVKCRWQAEKQYGH